MKKEKVLLYGYGNTYECNRHWIYQIYEVVGITDKKIEKSLEEKNVYTVCEALKLSFDKIVVTSFFYDEIKEELINKYNFPEKKIDFFGNEFLRERYVSFGEKNPNITFYVLRVHMNEVKNGFYNFYDRVLTTYHRTNQLGYQLVVDMKNYYTEYAGKERYGLINVWEEYYKQPCGYSLEEVYKSKHVLLSKFDDYEYNYPNLSNEIFTSNKWWFDVYQKLAELYPNKIKVSEVLREKIKMEMKRLGKLDNVLGVLARGTDMVSLRPHKHFIPYEDKAFMDIVERKFEEGMYTHIYIATEDADILEQFKKRFEEKIIYTDQIRVTKEIKGCIIDEKADRENDSFLKGLEYCTSIEVLARCKSFVANCNCGGALGAIAINSGRYRDCEILDAGIYE